MQVMGRSTDTASMSFDLDVGVCAVRRYEGLPLDLSAVRRALGLRGSSGKTARWESAIEELSAVLPKLARGRAMIRIEPVASLEPRRMVLATHAPDAEPPIAIEGAVGQFLAHARMVALFVATIGSGVERLSRGWLRRSGVVRGLVADALGSELAESVALRCQQDVRAWARQRGMDITPRYSPGYCGMDVRQQRVLFDQVPARRIGVHLTPSFLMTPVKSVSGLIGLAPAGLVQPEEYPCSRCDHPHCMQRRARLDVRRGTCVDWGTCGVPAPSQQTADGA